MIVVRDEREQRQVFLLIYNTDLVRDREEKRQARSDIIEKAAGQRRRIGEGRLSLSYCLVHQLIDVLKVLRAPEFVVQTEELVKSCNFGPMDRYVKQSAKQGHVVGQGALQFGSGQIGARERLFQLRIPLLHQAINVRQNGSSDLRASGSAVQGAQTGDPAVDVVSG